jgi:hypothetical protein
MSGRDRMLSLLVIYFSKSPWYMGTGVQEEREREMGRVKDHYMSLISAASWMCYIYDGIFAALVS